MGKRRVLCGYGIDVDAISNHLNTGNGSRANLSNVSRGYFGAKIGTKRLLDLFKSKNMLCSWFIPAHTIMTFPEEMAIIRDGGHDIGLHGYTHDPFEYISINFLGYPGDLTTKQFRDVMTKSKQILTDFLGKPPKGFTAPAWDPHPEQISIMEEMNLEYDHSFMHTDYQCYYAPKSGEQHITTDISKDASTWMVPSTKTEKSSVVVIPGNWTFDDWPAFQFEPRFNCPGYVDPRVIEHTWQESFLYCYEHYDTFIFPITIHPQISGKAHVLRMHERFIDWTKQFEGVEWCTFADMASEFKAGRI